VREEREGGGGKVEEGALILASYVPLASIGFLFFVVWFALITSARKDFFAFYLSDRGRGS